MVEEPVILTYTHPRERVLLNKYRDANPFFHLYEALWMLAGRNDVEPLAYYNKRMREFSDDGKTFNGAYGQRWRNWKAFSVRGCPLTDEATKLIPEPLDQLSVLVDHLRSKPESRRAVLQMWAVGDDLLKVDESKDVCCNTCVYFAVETGYCPLCKGSGKVAERDDPSGVCPGCNGMPHDRPSRLNMTVCNRSNDLIWGMLGANAVHFSFLQEYVTARLGLEVGVYNQFTNNLHCYTKSWEPEEWLRAYEFWDPEEYLPEVVPLSVNQVRFDQVLPNFVEHNSKPLAEEGRLEWGEPFLDNVAQPLLNAYHRYRRNDRHSGPMVDLWIGRIADDAWRQAAKTWVNNRRERKARARERKNLESYHDGLEGVV